MHSVILGEETDIDTQGKRLNYSGGRNWSVHQPRNIKDCWQHPRQIARQETDSSLEILERTWHCQNLDI